VRILQRVARLDAIVTEYAPSVYSIGSQTGVRGPFRNNLLGP